jgi:hypothetical protein
MKKNILLPAICYAAILTTSCKRSKPCELIYNAGGSMIVVMQPSDSLISDLKLFQHTTNVVITQQAKHYQISLVENDAANQKFIFKYKPASNFLGLDSVAFSSEDCATKTSVKSKIGIVIRN